VLNIALSQGRQDGVERDKIAVNIGDQCELHATCLSKQETRMVIAS
jgi:hypothetical protein